MLYYYYVEFLSFILKEVQVKLQRPYNVYHDYQECMSYQRKSKKVIQFAMKQMHKIAAIQLGK